MSHRQEKLSALFKKEISILIQETIPEEMGIVTLTELELTANIKEAKVYISLLDKSKEKEALKILNANSKGFQYFLGRKFRMKFTPKLIFLIDHGLDNIEKIDKILRKVSKK
ncbi:MAG: Ribosome-binding factor A [Berkelbacteria bacterium GW2011_GWB1_38_5]|uniref:Ribosome-binding factor A n=2 Tax=Candidatus Berkelbacteria TaxID=1618330 RepID=A0A0G0LGC9_9BACT|nr:MAG: Ribosome-binding factor A [Berkelbacteria bacterium GW2011_GWB1_38_5]KKQ90943.1 MAG: Ribosome-binding factor A [Berkelbacteria bacterium GW2011_GWA1_39_10]